MRFSEDAIEEEYQRRLLAHPHARWGWSFMYTPEQALVRARAVLVGLNPGGRQIDPPREWDYTAGVNAYLDEPWGEYTAGAHPLQRQAALLFEAAGMGGDEVFAGNLVPFRSGSWVELPDREGALAFGRKLWMEIIERTPARLYLSLGKRAGAEIADLIGARRHAAHSVEWGRQVIDEYRADDGRTVLAIPHLSRFQVFGGGRTAAAEAVRAAAGAPPH